MQAEPAKAQLARLTAREKECLRRCLLPQTAKEMAADLGISPHAVEKRLKMVRAKLGVSSSLAAARMLADVEGYQRVVPQNSDLPNQPRDDDHDVATSANRAPRWQTMGVLGMIAIAILVAVATQTTSPADDPNAPTIFMDRKPIASRRASWNEAVEFDKEAFKNLDKNGSSDLDPQEASALELRDSSRDQTLPPAPPSGQRDLAGEHKWMMKLDTDRDGRVSEAEYVGYMLPWTLASGVPAEWHPHGKPDR